MERSVGRQVVVKFPKSSERSECGQQPRGGHPAWSMPHEAARVGDRQRVGDKQPLPRSLTPAKTGPGGAAVRATPGSAQAQGLLCTEDRAAPRPGPAPGGLLQPQSHGEDWPPLRMQLPGPELSPASTDLCTRTCASGSCVSHKMSYR